MTSNKNEAMWQSITDSVNSVRADAIRTKEKIKEKWSYLKSAAKAKCNEYKRAAERTGGGDELADKYLQIMNMVPAVSFQGLTGQER